VWGKASLPALSTGEGAASLVMTNKKPPKKVALSKKTVILQRVSLIRPAPVELPQIRNKARVDGCSGAM